MIPLIPERILSSKEGAARRPTPKDVAGLFHECDIVFFRKDGWSLATRREWEDVAYKSWDDEWFAFYELSTQKILPICEHRLWKIDNQREKAEP